MQIRHAENPLSTASGGACCNAPLDAVEHILRTQSHPMDTAAMLVEPIQGEGGIVIPPAGYLEGLRKVCDKHGILLIIDEVQSGAGRTGALVLCARWATAGTLHCAAKNICIHGELEYCLCRPSVYVATRRIWPFSAPAEVVVQCIAAACDA